MDELLVWFWFGVRAAFVVIGLACIGSLALALARIAMRPPDVSGRTSRSTSGRRFDVLRMRRRSGHWEYRRDAAGRVVETKWTWEA